MERRIRLILVGLVVVIGGAFVFYQNLNEKAPRGDRELEGLIEGFMKTLPDTTTVEQRDEIRLECRLPGRVERELTSATEAVDVPLADKGGPQFVPFIRERYDQAKAEYRWIPEEGPVAGDEDFWGYALVLLFVFVMGMGATIAEPSLNALGVTLEELTTGTYKRSFLILTVALSLAEFLNEYSRTAIEATHDRVGLYPARGPLLAYTTTARELERLEAVRGVVVTEDEENLLVLGDGVHGAVGRKVGGDRNPSFALVGAFQQVGLEVVAQDVVERGVNDILIKT